MNSLVLCALLLFPSQERHAQDEQEAEDPVVAPTIARVQRGLNFSLRNTTPMASASFRLRRCHRNGISFPATNYRFTNVANLLDYFARQFAKRASESN
jgi:hypothetical protein